jgi:hypothetical protein
LTLPDTLPTSTGPSDQQPIAKPPVDFDPATHPIIAIHFFGLQPGRQVAA